MSKRVDWLAVDWVGLGCAGWEIDETGAELVWPVNAVPQDVTMYAHLDRTTLDLILHGSPAFCQRVIGDLQLAGVPGVAKPWQPVVPLTGNTSAGNTSAALPQSWFFCNVA